MDIRKLQRAIVDGLEDVKAQNIAVFNTEHLSPLFERVVVASGTSNRQTKALAASVRETVKERGMPVLSIEGEDNGEWIIVDCGAAVVHVMQPAIREYYRLEEIWGGKPVRLKVAATKGLPAASYASEDDGETPAAAAPRKAAGKSTGTSATGRKTPAKKTTAKATAAKTPPARKAAPSRAPGAKAAGGAPRGDRPSAKAATGASAKPAAKTAGKRPAGRPGARRATSPIAVKTVVVAPPRSASARAPGARPPARKTTGGGRKGP